VVPLVGGLALAAAVLTASALAFGSPPPQPPFPYPAIAKGVAGFTVGDCGTPETPIGLHPGLAQDLLPHGAVAYGALQNATVRRPRIFIAKRHAETRRWLYLLDQAEKQRLGAVDFKKCSVIAVFLPGNIDMVMLGVRVNDPETLTLGIGTPPHRTGHFCAVGGGTSGTTSGTPPPSTNETCVDFPPVAGAKYVMAVPAAPVAGVRRTFAITQPPPPPLPANSTTG
jgi:hypothetical protein